MQWENSRTKERRKSHLRSTWLLDAKQVITDIARGEADLDTLKAGASLIPAGKVIKLPKVIKAIGNVGKTGFKKGKEGEKIAKSGQVKQTKAKNKGGSGRKPKHLDSNPQKLKLEDFTKEVLETKPRNSPVPEKWYERGGEISIDKDGVWIYTNKKGITVSYKNGFPDFSPYYHPTVKPVEIKFANPVNRGEDFKNANLKAGLNKNSNPPVPSLNRPPDGYTWHHHEDGKTMVLVEKKVHSEFSHVGGISTSK